MENKQETTTAKPNLYDLSPQRIENAVEPIVSPSFRIQQIREWMYDHGVDSFAAMTNLPKDLRGALSERFDLSLPAVASSTDPSSDGSVKYLFRLGDQSEVEAVYMPMGRRTTICLSSQAGCAVGCTFCVTGFFGAGRNLTPSEMVGQVKRVRDDKGLSAESANVVFMGMGEPLLNVENVAIAIEILCRTMSARRITISTSGIIPGIEDLARMDLRPNLAVSINAPDQKRREQIMPITAKYPLNALIKTLRTYPLDKGREITAEYVLLAGFNDSPADARALGNLLRGGPFKVNAIPFNPDPRLPVWMRRPSNDAVDRFAAALSQSGTPVTVRRSKGDEIAAACGQLKGKSVRRR